MRHRIAAIAFVCFASAGLAPADEPPSSPSNDALRITKTRGGEVRALWSADGKRVVLDVVSPKGIGHTVIERKAERWPESVVLRLHLRGLEGLAVSRDDLPPVADGDRREPPEYYRAAIRRIGMPEGDGSVNLENCYFEATLPKKLQQANPRSISVDWVDFFRG